MIRNTEGSLGEDTAGANARDPGLSPETAAHPSSTSATKLDVTLTPCRTLILRGISSDGMDTVRILS
ncbi:MAG: hypothetical protein R3178_09620, partial [Rhodothermales bacterium]|nr:hypothetical protein [Rhodothermales bacterium]